MEVLHRFACKHDGGSSAEEGGERWGEGDDPLTRAWKRYQDLRLPEPIMRSCSQCYHGRLSLYDSLLDDLHVDCPGHVLLPRRPKQLIFEYSPWCTFANCFMIIWTSEKPWLLHLQHARADHDEHDPVHQPDMSCHLHIWPYLRVAGADHDELGRMHHTDTLTLNGVDASSRTVQNEVHDTIIQQVDLIHIQDAAVAPSLCMQKAMHVSPMLSL